MYKPCPSCGTHNASDAKFCVKCGSNLTNVSAVTPNEETEQSSPTSQSQQQAPDNQQNQSKPTQNVSAQPNPTIQQVKKYSGNYFSTLVSAWRHPSDTEAIAGTEKKYYGYVTLLLIAILATFNFWMFLKSLMRVIANMISTWGSEAANYPSNSDPSNSDTILAALDNSMSSRITGLLFQFFVYVLIILALMVLMGFLTQRFFIGDPAVTLTDFTNRFAFRASGTLPVLVLLFLFSWLSRGFISIIIIDILLIIYQIQINVALFVTSNEGSKHKKLDRVYSLTIMMVAINVLTTIILSIWVIQSIVTNMPKMPAYF